MNYREAYEEVTRVWLALRAGEGHSDRPSESRLAGYVGPSLDDDLEGGFPELLDLLWRHLTDEERELVDPGSEGWAHRFDRTKPKADPQ